MKNRYTFSGHESFPCKSLWLKKGYDFVVGGNDFNSPDAVITLGVGKNMVASIRFWLRAFGITDNDALTELGSYLFDESKGKDKYLEDRQHYTKCSSVAYRKNVPTLSVSRF